jgi:Na+/melibiose symporter-like transporter
VPIRTRKLAVALIALGLACGITGGVIFIRLAVARVGHKPMWIAIAAVALIVGYFLFWGGGRSFSRTK